MSYEPISIASLMLALVSVWCRPGYLWAVPFAVFVLTGLAGGWLTPAALVSMAVLGVSVWLHVTARRARARAAAMVLLVLVALVFGLHLAPGFESAYAFSDAPPPGRTAAEGIRFSADKPLVGLFLLLAYRRRLCRSLESWRRAITDVALPVLSGIVGVYGVALAVGYVVVARPGLDPALLPFALVAFVRNLLFTVVAEEMLFRRVIQARLATLWRGRHARGLALVATSVLFGLVHAYGGWRYALLATLAGALYGYAFLRTGRVESAIVAHATLNLGYALLLSPLPSG